MATNLRDSIYMQTLSIIVTSESVVLAVSAEGWYVLDFTSLKNVQDCTFKHPCVIIQYLTEHRAFHFYLDHVDITYFLHLLKSFALHLLFPS